MPEFQMLDVFVYRGHSLTSKLVRFLTSVRYGIPFKDAYSHIAIGYDEETTISAESKGTMIVPNSEIDTKNKSDVVIWRFDKLHQWQKDNFYKVADPFIGAGYAYARYALDAARIFSFVCFILLLLFGTVNWRYRLLFLGLILLLQLASIWLRKADKKTYDCAELSALILNKLHLMPFFSSKARNEFPNSQLTKMRMLKWHHHATVVAKYNYKKKEWVLPKDDMTSAVDYPFTAEI